MPKGKAGKKKVVSAVKAAIAGEEAAIKKGKQKSTGKKLAGALIPMMGSLAGGYLGGTPHAARVGSTAGKLISAITGFGDYKVNSNTMIKGNTVPQFQQGNDGVTVSDRVFIKNVIGSIAFQNESFPLNPGLYSTFPKLAQMAELYEEYEMLGLVFMYRPTSGTAVAGTNPALGVVVMATDYDALNAPFVTKQQMESYEYSTSIVPDKAALHPVECARKRNVMDNLFVRTTDPPADSDLRLYDMGNFQIATEGMLADGNVVGELWVTYHCRFRKPRIPGTVVRNNFLHLLNSSTMNQDHFWSSTGPTISAESTMPPEAWAVRSSDGFNSLALFNKGLYFIAINHKDTDNLNNEQIEFTFGSNVIYGPPLFWNGTAVYAICHIGGVSTIQVWVQIKQDGSMETYNNQRIIFGWTGGVNGSIDVCVTKVNGNGVEPDPAQLNLRFKAPRRLPIQLPKEEDTTRVVLPEKTCDMKVPQLPPGWKLVQAP